MNERPILFSGPMVRAILEGRKTMTRRVIRIPEWVHKDPFWDQWGNAFWLHDDSRPGEDEKYANTWPPCDASVGENPGAGCPYGRPGDLLWVRETWRPEERETDAVDGVRFAADGAFVEIVATRAAADDWCAAYDNGRHGLRWRPSIYMPRWASRLTLRVTDVRVERLQEISEEDVDAEGVGTLGVYMTADQRIARFRDGWDSLNAKRAPWASNPWVWVVSFART